jgi:membrane-associated phospholipid phosphatase
MNHTDSVEEADIEVGAKLAAQKDDPWVRRLAKVGKAGDQEPLYAAGGVVVLAGLLAWNRPRARLGVSIILAVAAADLAKNLTKRLVKRTRPHVLLDEGRYQSKPGGSPSKPEQSFPSGHVACTLAAARALSRHHPKAAPYAAAAVATIGLARLAKGAHWPLDVAAGLAVGLLAEASSCMVLRSLGVPQVPSPRRDRDTHDQS